LSRKVHCIYKVQINQTCSNIPEIINEASVKDPEYTVLLQQTKEALLKWEKSDFKINLITYLPLKKEFIFLTRTLLNN